MGDKLLGTDS